MTPWNAKAIIRRDFQLSNSLLDFCIGGIKSSHIEDVRPGKALQPGKAGLDILAESVNHLAAPPLDFLLLDDFRANPPMKLNSSWLPDIAALICDSRIRVLMFSRRTG